MALVIEQEIIYPSTDAKPMAESTIQFDHIVLIKEGLEATFMNDEHVFVAGDLFWYPEEGNNKLRFAPDVMVVFGRPKGHRKSYMQWKEDDIPPQVVFEIISEGNTPAEMSRKFAFYIQHGAQEYYIYDPQRHELLGWQRNENILQEIEQMNGWVSPLLQIRFEIDEQNLLLFRQDGSKFKTYTELVVEKETLTREKESLEKENKYLSQEKEMLSQEKEETLKKMESLAQKLRELGVNPDEL